METKLIVFLVIMLILLVILAFERMSAKKSRQQDCGFDVTTYEDYKKSREPFFQQMELESKEKINQLKNANATVRKQSIQNGMKISNLVEGEKSPEQIADELAMIDYLKGKGKL